MSNIEAERSVLGACLMSQAARDDAMGVLESGDFASEKNGTVFREICNMITRGEAVDCVTLIGAMRSRGTLDQVGGATYIAKLDGAVLTAKHAGAYAKVVKNDAIRRRIMEAAQKIVAAGADVADVGTYADQAEQMILSAATRKQTKTNSIRAVMKGSMDDLEKAYNSDGLTGLPTGFADLDQMLGGLQPGSLTILAARPAMGKTALGLNFAQNSSIRHGAHVLVVSLEMSDTQLGARLLGAEGRVDIRAMARGKMTESGWARLASSAGRIADSGIEIIDSSAMSIGQLRADARRIDRKNKLSLVVVDYIQLMTGDNKEGREKEVAGISLGLKSLARDLDIPVVALSQLNRSLESRTDKRPLLSDLRESGALEQDADNVLLLYREGYYKRDEVDKGKTELIIAKQRNGPTGTVPLLFEKEYTSFKSADWKYWS